MLDFKVNRIITTDNVKHGIVTNSIQVVENFKLVYGFNKTVSLLKTIEDKKQNCYLICRLGDYVGFLNYQTDFGFSLKLTDFENDFDSALDEYLDLQKKDWKEEDIIKYLKIAKEIENESQPSKMIISNPQ
ncbi:hypothetical protein [uncultured Flavobacterium sp.]|uniref:hypothetical protein n=1 Tax=uncultured Flavobacterium sp. TaxID=165435 RepID=UPI003081A819